MTEQTLKSFFNRNTPRKADVNAVDFDFSKVVADIRTPFLNAVDILPTTTGFGSVGVISKDIPMMEYSLEDKEIYRKILGIKKVEYNIKTFIGGISISKENIEDTPEFFYFEIFKEEASRVYNNIRVIEVCKKLKELETVNVQGINQVNEELAKLSNLKDKNMVLTTSALASLQAENHSLAIDKTTNTSNFFYSDSIFVVDDELLGKKGDKKIFIGSLREVVTLVERGRDRIKFVENNDVYSGNIVFYTRFGVVVTRPEAGKLLVLK